MLDCSEGAHSFRVKSRPERSVNDARIHPPPTRSLLEVKWFRQRRGRSAELDEADMLARAEDAVALALEAADQASKASASMTDCLAQLAADRQAKKLKEEDDARLGSLLVPLIVCAASLVAAIGVGLKVPAAFSDPQAQPDNIGTVQVAVEDTSRTVTHPMVGGSIGQAALEQQETVTVVMTHLMGSSDVSLDVYFPEQFAGLRFAILLSGAAAFKQLYLPGDARSGEVAPCQPSAPYMRLDPHFISAPDECQILAGVIPPAGYPISALNKSTTAFDNGPPCTVAEPQDNYIPVTVDGAGYLIARGIDWAHQEVLLPSFDSYADDIGVKWKHLMPNILGCQALNLDQDRRVEDVEPVPAETSDAAVQWASDTTDTSGAAVMFANRDAAEVGNGLIIITGVLASLGIGLIPVAYDAARRRRQYQRVANLVGGPELQRDDDVGPHGTG